MTKPSIATKLVALASFKSTKQSVVDLGVHGTYFPHADVTAYVAALNLASAVKVVADGLAGHILTRIDATAALNDALTLLSPTEASHPVPPSLDKRAGFSAFGILQRIAQDLSGSETGPINEHTTQLALIAGELGRRADLMQPHVHRVPDATQIAATEDAAHLRAATRQFISPQGLNFGRDSNGYSI